MFAYYVRIALLGLRRQPVLSALMVLAIGVGVATAMTALTLLHRLGADPIPDKSERLFALAVDNWDGEDPWGERDGVPVAPDLLTHKDAMALLAADKAQRTAVMFAVGLIVQPDKEGLRPFATNVRATHPDFFPMFDVPFIHGGPWSEADEASQGRVVVLAKEMNDRLFGGENSVGRRIRMSDQYYTVAGVIDDWRPRPKFYDTSTGALNDPELIYIPLSLAIAEDFGVNGNINCWESPGQGRASFLASECIWLTGWVELPDAAAVAAYRDFMASYVAEQKQAGRAFARPHLTAPVPLRQWLDLRGVVPDDMRMFTLLGFAFLLVCLLNAGTLLLAKFLRRSGEIGLRRAIGASKRSLFAQYLTESSVVGMLGAAVGLLLTLGGLAGVRTLIPDAAPEATLDFAMFAACVAIAVGTSVLAGIYPAWRACNVAPAAQLKTN
jgi:putative ABC transport system permease protein